MDTKERLERIQSLKIANMDSAIAGIMGSFLGGNFIVGFIKYLNPHSSDYWVGLFAAYPSLCGLMMIPGSLLGQRYKSYKRYIRPGGLSWRILHLTWIPMPLLALSADLRLGIMAIAGATGGALVNMVGVTYNDWLTQLTEPGSRSYYFTRRTAVLGMVGSVAAVCGAMMLDGFTSTHNQRVGFTVIFALGVTCGLISQYFFDQMLDIEREKVVRTDILGTLRHMMEPLKDRKFRPVLVFSFVSLAGQTMSGALFGAYAFEVLKMPYTLLQMCGLIQATAHLLVAAKWGGWMDRFGVRPVVALATLGIIFAPVAWLFTRPQDLWLNVGVLVVGHIFSGLAWSGALPGNFNILVATAPEETRATYLGIGQTIQALGASVAPLIGAATLAQLRSVVNAGDAYKAIFVGSILLRIVALLLLAPVKEEGARSIRYTVRSLWTGLLRR